MATPAVVTSGVTDITAVQTWNQYLATPLKYGTKAVWARIRYTGSVWQVHSGMDSQEIQSSQLTWDTNHVNVAVGGFTTAPNVQATGLYTAGGVYLPFVESISTSLIRVYWVDAAFATVTTESDKMDAFIFAWGV